MARAVIAAGYRPRADLTNQAPSQSSAPSAHAANDVFRATAGKLAHNIAMRLKEREKKFSGDLGESWMEFVNEYSQISRDYNLGPSQKLQYLQNLLHGDAKRFYLDEVDGHATTFQQAVTMLEDE